ncbi:MAG: glutathione transferase GstA [Rhodocyclaceae bacterium]|nr:glutathione transferase GstA [Rhodocyclaceae bacterium]
MKLYYKAGACSLSPHIALCEAGLPHDLESVDLKTKVMGGGGDYLAVNPKGYVPALQLDDGQVLTEGPAIVQYIADRAPEKKLAPPAGSLERYRLQEWLNYISTEIHKTFSPLFNPASSADWKEAAKALLARRIGFVSEKLGNQPYLMGEQFTVADGYLFTCLSWGQYVGVDVGQWPNLAAYLGRVAGRPGVQAALKAEGLMK